MAKTIHLENWIAKAETEYYFMFIKAWIPFNAWYFDHFSTTNDTEAINKLKNESNTIKNKIISLITGNDNDSVLFKLNIASLHIELKKKSILNRGRIISFEKLYFDDFFPEISTKVDNNIIYKVIPNKTTGFKILIVAKDNSKTYMDKSFNPYNLNLFLTENQYISLPTDKMKAIIREMFEKSNPNLPIPLICLRSRTDKIIIDNKQKIYFINNPDLIAKSLIQILYELRCILFHGVINPNEANQKVYEYAYSILLNLIKELR